VRLYNRLGAGASTSGKGSGAAFTTHLVPIAGADWRPAFAWARGAFPSFFLPASLVLEDGIRVNEGTGESLRTRPSQADRSRVLPLAPSPSPSPSPVPPYLSVGLGLYTCAQMSDVDAPFLDSISANLLWDASFFFAYQGMFLAPNVSWASNYGDGEELVCGPSWSHGEVVTRGRIAESFSVAQAAGVMKLAYFNLFHFGQNVRVLPPEPYDPALGWTDSSHFLAQNLSEAVVPGPVYDWQSSVLLDPASPRRAAFLAAQVQDKVDSFGGLLQGLVIDEIHPLATVTFNTDAGGDYWDVAWCGSECRMMITGWRAAAHQTSSILRTGEQPSSGGRLLLVNFVGGQRVDVLSSSDGVFTEDYVAGDHFPLLAATGLATTGKPPGIIWTYSWDQVVSSVGGGADAYIQSHLHHKLFPMAPVFGADHSIDNVTAGAAGRQMFLDYGLLWAAVKGGCWHLAADPVRVEGTSPAPTPSSPPSTSPAVPSAMVNAFTVGGGCTDPSTDAGNGPVSTLVLFVWLPGAIVGPPPLPANTSVGISFVAPSGIGGQGSMDCQATTPGAGAWKPLPTPVQSEQDERWRFPGGASALAMSRGAVMVRCAAASR
jgi:hypothetical protein